MKEIQLTKGMVAIVDDDCPIEILERKWFFINNYAGRNNSRTSGKQRTLLMHRLIMNAPDGMQVDHINGNKLDNRKANLRLCTNAENQRNSKMQKNNTTGFKGVCKHKGKYMAGIAINKKSIHLGTFLTPEEAALAYNEAAIKYHGEFANLNKIDTQ